MELYTQSELAAAAKIHVATLNQMSRRGVIPRPDISTGRGGYYSGELASALIGWLTTEYQKSTRYEPGHFCRVSGRN